MSDERESRADRLRRRRSAKRDRPELDESADQSKTDESSKPSQESESGAPEETDEPAEAEDRSEPASVKEEQVGTYMYLPESQHRKLNHVYNRLKADYEFEFEEEFQKNRHFYPALVQLGMEALEGATADEVRDLVRELDRD